MRYNPLQRRGESRGEDERDRQERKRKSECEDEKGGNVCGGVCTCTFNRLITCIPKSGKPRRHAARARVQNSNYAIIVTRGAMRVCTSCTPPRRAVDAPRISPLANKRCIRGILATRRGIDRAKVRFNCSYGITQL